MRTFGRIECAIWRNRKFRSLTDDARQLFIYLLTSPHGNSIGLFYLPVGYIQADTGWDENRIEMVMEALSERFIERDTDHDLVLIRGWFGHNDIENPNVAKAAFKSLNELPCSPLKAAVIKAMGELGKTFLPDFLEPYRNGIEAVSEAVSEAYRNPEPEPKPYPEPIAEAEGARTRTLADQVLELIPGASNNPNFLAGYRTVADWQRHGADPELILTTVQAVMARRGDAAPPHSLSYFTSAIADAVQQSTRTTQEFAREPDRRMPAGRQARRDPGIEALAILRRSREGDVGAEGAGVA